MEEQQQKASIAAAPQSPVKVIGRPTRLTPEVQKKLCDAVQLGAPYSQAARYAGVSVDIFEEWRARGKRETHGRHRELMDALAVAEGAAVVGWLAKIEKAANEGVWQAAAWKLERKHPEDFGRHIAEVRGKEGGPVDIRLILDSLPAGLAAAVVALATGTDDPGGTGSLALPIPGAAPIPE